MPISAKNKANDDAASSGMWVTDEQGRRVSMQTGEIEGLARDDYGRTYNKQTGQYTDDYKDPWGHLPAAHAVDQAPPEPLPESAVPKGHADVHTTKPDPGSDDPLDPVNAPPGQQAAYSLRQWQRDLPGYLQGQIGGAQENARLGLAKEIQNTRASANSRGLLYSGLEGGGEAANKAEASSRLASDIQNINVGAEDITSQKYGLAQQEANAEDANILARQQMQVDQSQHAYELAMQEQQNQGSFWKELASGVGSVVGAVAGSFVGQPVAGAAAGGALGRGVSNL